MNTTTSTQDNETFPQSLDEVVGFAPMVCSESKEDVATKSTTVCIVINATPNIPEGFFSINLEKSLILKNWKNIFSRKKYFFLLRYLKNENFFVKYFRNKYLSLI